MSYGNLRSCSDWIKVDQSFFLCVGQVLLRHAKGWLDCWTLSSWQLRTWSLYTWWSVVFACLLTRQLFFCWRLTMYQVCIQATSGARVDVEFVAGALSLREWFCCTLAMIDSICFRQLIDAFYNFIHTEKVKRSTCRNVPEIDQPIARAWSTGFQGRRPNTWGTVESELGDKVSWYGRTAIHTHS